MDIKYLETYKTITEVGSFQKAASRLNYAQSTVTFHVQQIEQELSIKLFEKIGRRMVLTKAGEDILPFVNNILQSMEQIENYGKTGSELSGVLKVAMPESLLTYKMQKVLTKFRKEAPNVTLSVQAFNCYDIRDRVFEGEFDLGVHYDVGGYPGNMTIERLGSCSLAMLGAKDLTEGERDFITPNQRKDMCYMTNDMHSIFQGLTDAYLKDKSIELGTILELGSIEAIKKSVASNLGVAVLPEFTAREEIDSGEVIKLPTDLDEQKLYIVCSYHKNKWITPAMELFIRILREDANSN